MGFAGFATIDSSNKTSLALNGGGGIDAVNVLADVNVPSSVTIEAEVVNDPTSSIISASNLILIGATNIGDISQPLNTAVDTLQLSNVTGDVYLRENNDLQLMDSSVGGDLSLTNLTGNINASGVMDVSGSLGVISANGSSVTFTNINNNILGTISVMANNGSLNDVQIRNGAATDFGQLNTANLTVNANGDVTDSGSLLVSNLATIDANGNNVLLDDSNNDFGSVTISSADQVVLADLSDIGLNAIVGSGVSINSGGQIIDSNGSAMNLSAGSVTLSAVNGIGDGDALEIQAGSMELANTATGDVAISNTGDLNVLSVSNDGVNAGSVQISTTGSLDQQGAVLSNGSVNLSAGNQYNQVGNISVNDTGAAVRVAATSGGINMSDTAVTTTTGGDITYTAIATVNVSSLDAVFGEGIVDITSGAGDILSTRAPDYSRPNVTGGVAVFNADLGSLGTFGRPLVVNVPGNVLISTLTSVDPIYLIQPAQIINESRVLFGINDVKAEVGGNQRTEVDALAIIDPAIFTKVKTYREDESPIRLPADQLVEEEDDKYKNKQDPDIFEQEKPYEVESSNKEKLEPLEN